MSWNYRIMKRTYENGEEEFGLYEVYYDENGQPNGWSADARPITAESLEGLKWVQEKFAEALEKPVLLYTEKESG